MARFVIRNYGSSRNLPDGHGSYIFMERDSARETEDEALAELFASYPDVHVSGREDVAVAVAPLPPPEGPPPLEGPPDEQEDDDDQDEDVQEEDEAVDYSALFLVDLQEIAKERDIKTAGLKKSDLVEALLNSDAWNKSSIK